MRAIFVAMSFLIVKNITGYNEGRLVLKDVSFGQNRFENIAIAGETGSGKTSLLKMIAGLMQPSSGKILLNGERVAGPDEQLIPGNKKIGYLSQHFELRNNYRVEELLDMANKMPPEEADKIYDICNVRHLLKRWSDELSGGEKQRVSLARLLTTSPELLLLDEPYSNMDMPHKQQMKEVIENIQKENGISCILVSHDAMDILSWADTVFFMKDGDIIQKGTPTDLYNKPVGEYAASLLGAYNLLDTAVLKEWGGANIINGKLFFRPEHIKIVDALSAPIVGVVRKILFWGSYYTVDVLVGTHLISVQVCENSVQMGDIVGLDFSLIDAWNIRY